MYNGFKTKRNIIVVLLLVFFISLGISIVNVINSKAASNRKVVNVVFVLDNTGSMSDEIANVKNNIGVFADYISNKEGIDELRMALITYQDITSYYNDSYEDSVVYLSSSGSPWFTDAEELKSTINSIALGNGGDIAETLYDGLGFLVDDLLGAENATIPFSSDAYKFAFVLTDADVKTDNYHGITGMDHMVSLLNEKNIYTSVVCPTSYKTYYQSLYEETGGTWIDINSSNFSDAMVEYADSILSIVQPDVVDLSFSVNDIYSFEPLAKEYGIDTDAAEYTSADESLFCFDSTLKYVGTALSPGNVYVTITDGVIILECNITITENEVEVPVEELALSIEIYVGVDQTVYVKAIALPVSATEGGLIWHVGDSSIISIEEVDNNTCLLKGVSSGTTTITVITKDGGYSASTEVTVTVDPIINVEGVEISGCDSEIEMTIDSECSVTGSVLPADATNNGGFWYSSDSNIVEIVSSSANACTFKAVSCGYAKIYFVSNEGGYTASVGITINHTYGDTPYLVTEDKEIYICTVCGNAIEVSIEHAHNYIAVVTEPTCTEQGYTTYTCEGCGDSYIDDYVDVVGHDYVLKSMTWDESTDETTLLFVCRYDESHTVTAVAVVTAEVINEATETTSGEVKYTVTVTLDGQNYSYTKTATTPALNSLNDEIDGGTTDSGSGSGDSGSGTTDSGSGSGDSGSGSGDNTSSDTSGLLSGSGCATFFAGGGSSFGGDLGLVIASFAILAFVVVARKKRTV